MPVLGGVYKGVYNGELIGYAMEVDSYEEYLEDNDVNQDDLKGFK